MAEDDKPKKKPAKKPVSKSQEKTVKRSAPENDEKTVKKPPKTAKPKHPGQTLKQGEATLPAPPPAASTPGPKASAAGSQDKTLQDPPSASGVGRTPPPPAKPRVKASAAKQAAADTAKKPDKSSTRGDYEQTIVEAGRDTNLEKTIQDNWAGTIVDEENVGLSLKSKTQAVPSGRSSVTVKSRVFLQAPRTDTQQLRARDAGADYELVEVLGEGGMGLVYTARQTAVDRMIAVKMIKGQAAQQDSSRNKFLAEAAVTADLDHPGVVPVYDLGQNETGAVFYAMKKVKGNPWSEVIQEKDPAENLEVLLRICDAVAFAHDKGVVHRDLKPENVMLGDYGEALVMDWGLAGAVSEEAKADRITAENACCGTPCYMAPEMALGMAPRIGKHSDIYLLGAILFEIVTGQPPHSGEDVMSCLMNAGTNDIVEPPVEGELIDIAMTAMASEPEDRYQSVQEFQKAIRDYQEHFESLNLSNKSQEDLQRAQETGEYNDFAKALYGFQEARSLWSGNDEALEGEIETRRLYAECAADKEDLDLADSLLLEDEPSHAELRKEVAKALKQQQARARRLKIMTYGTYGGVAAIILILTGATLWIGREMKIARDQKAIAEEQKDLAQEQKALAEKRETEAQDAKDLALARQKEAEDAKALAVQRQKEAEEQRKQAEEARKEAEEQRQAAQQALADTKAAQAREAEQRAQKEKLDKQIQFTLDTQKNEWWTVDAAEARARQKEAAGEAGLPVERRIDLGGGASMAFVLIPPGSFGMGSPFQEVDRAGEESLHRVRLTRPFYMAVHECTRGQWQAVAGALPEAARAGAEVPADHPVTRVSWKTVQEQLIPALQKRAPEGYTVRLPTEAEWEYAARSGTNTAYFNGARSAALAEAGWFQVNSGRKTHPVGRKAANAWGLHDVHGNVAEYCVDLYDPRVYRDKTDGVVEDPRVEGDGTRRVYRGGGWISTAAQCRSAYRSWAHEENAHDYIGVRVVLVPPEG